MEQKRFVRRLTLRYAVLQMLFWSLYGVCWSYQVVTMTFAGMSNGQAGVVICVSLLLTTALQPVLSGFLDRSRRVKPWMAAAALMALTALIGAAMRLTYRTPAALALLYVLLGITIISFDPILSSLCMDLIRRGLPVNFGVPRGLGSLAYALVVLAMGEVIEVFSPVPGMTLTALLALCTLAAVLWFRPKEALLPPEPPAAEEVRPLATLPFLRHYPRFSLLLVGCALLMGTQVFMSSFLYLLVDRLGGSEGSLGLLLCLAGIAEMPGMLLFMYLRRRGVAARRLFRLCALFFVPKYVLSYLAGSMPALAAAQLIAMMTAGFYLVMIPYYAAEAIDGANQAKGQALISVAGNGVGAALASLFGGTIFDRFGVLGGTVFASALALLGLLCVWLGTGGGRRSSCAGGENMVS